MSRASVRLVLAAPSARLWGASITARDQCGLFACNIISPFCLSATLKPDYPARLSHGVRIAASINPYREVDARQITSRFRLDVTSRMVGIAI